MPDITCVLTFLHFVFGVHIILIQINFTLNFNNTIVIDCRSGSSLDHYYHETSQIAVDEYAGLIWMRVEKRTSNKNHQTMKNLYISFMFYVWSVDCVYKPLCEQEKGKHKKGETRIANSRTKLIISSFFSPSQASKEYRNERMRCISPFFIFPIINQKLNVYYH